MSIKKDKKILIIGDKRADTESLHALLHSHGFSVSSADSLNNAEKELKKTPAADLLLVDASLVCTPSETGYTDVNRLITDNPVIFLLDEESEISSISGCADMTRTCGFIKRDSGDNYITATIDTAFRIIGYFKESEERRKELEAASNEIRNAMEEIEEASGEMADTNALLEESESRFRTVFRNAPIPIAISLMKEETYLDINLKFLEMTGFRREQVIGKKRSDVIKLVSPEDSTVIMKEFMEKGLISNYPIITEDFSGNRYHNLLSAYQVEINNVPCLVSMLADISSLKAVEEKLVEKERLLAEANNMLRLIIDTIPGHLYWKDKDLKYAGANRLFVNDAGFSSTVELIGLREKDMPWIQQIAETDTEDYNIMQTGKAVHNNIELHTIGAGEQCWFRKNKIPLKNTDDQTIGILCSYEDITKTKLNEDELRRSRAELQSIFDASMVGVALIRGRIFIKINSALCKTLGYTEDGILNHDARIIYNDDAEYKRVGAELYGNLEKYGQAVVEAKMVTKDGRMLDTLISASLVDHNNPTGDVCMSLNDITDFKRAENEAREKEERLRGIASNVPGVIYQFYTDDTGKYGVTFMSDKAPAMFGINATIENFFSEFVTRVHKDDRPRFFDSIKKSVEFISSWEFEGRFVKYSGEIMWFRAMSSPSRQKDRIVFNGVIIDITEKKISEEELRRREDRFRSMIQSSSDMIFIMDSNNLITYESPSVSRILGYEEGFFLGRSPLQLVHPDDLDIIMKEMGLVYKNENPGIPTEFRFKHSDGNWLYLEAVASNLVNNPAVNGIVIIARDITGRKLAGDALRMSEAKFRNIFENMSVGYFRSGLDGGILDVNPACLMMLGFESVEEGKKFLKNRTSNIYADLNDWKMVRNTVMAQPDPPVFTVRLKRKNGSEFTAELKMKIVMADDGTQMNVEGLIEDISERVKTQEVLIQSEKMLTVAGLAAGMAHEINNPLGIIMQNAENAMHRLLDELPGNIEAADSAGIDFKKLGRYIELRRVDRYLSSIREAGVRAAKIVGNMLQFSRGADSKFDCLDINTILDKTLDLAANDYDITKNYDFKKIRIKKNYGEIPEIRCTEIQVEQVFLNILKNAAQAMSTKNHAENEKPEITISTHHENNSVVITFTDNGPGMDENTRKKIFEPFYTTKQPGNGTGLGLSVSYYIIVNGHGGTITAESTPGKGSSFIITLPVKKDIK
ncbi:MAG TPA: PAS domain S-box protein [Spirochaetota bacterium]|nr:PAS domain S-box protein [Spirochaetota bacterium]